jgi:hypothetical protein
MPVRSCIQAAHEDVSFEPDRPLESSLAYHEQKVAALRNALRRPTAAPDAKRHWRSKYRWHLGFARGLRARIEAEKGGLRHAA